MRKISYWLFKCFISIGILYYLFLKIPFSQVVSALRNTKIIYLLPILLLQIAMSCVSAAQLKIFVSHQKMNFTVLKLIKINFITLFYRLFLPGELLTGVVRWHKLSKPNGMRAQALACIILTRAINIFTLAVVGVTFFLIERPYNSNYLNVSLILGLLASFLIFISIVNTGISSRMEYFVGKLNLSKIPVLFQEKIGKIWNSLKEFHKISSARLNFSLFLGLLFHFLQICSLYFFMRAMDINITIISIAWILAAIFFLQILPISISGFGVREGVFVFLLRSYGVYGSNAMALSFLIFGVSVVFAIAGGIFEAIEFFKRDRSGG